MLVKRAIQAIAIATVLGLSLAGCGTRTGYANDADIPESLGTDGTSIVVGDEDADTTVRLFEDLRCPACQEFETQGAGAELNKLTQKGSVQVHYTLASFLDDKLGGNGSKKAANALRAALEEGKFVEYHQVLYAHQPDEALDGFTDGFLLKMASRVEGLRGPDFDAAVRTMRYQDFVTASEKAYQESSAYGTPSLQLSGVKLPEFERGYLSYYAESPVWTTKP
ncbi:DsbA family protein [Streptomyces halstedii]|uniref:DsbA family protein n=1 Tax=Streptomyces halstedii TaxID=1944 RepID=A0ABS6TX58_STRHA|nr:thioredoxin domain-containing protein [Streptomyces halstedii]MBV7672858.1 DsbA family protein [Streptomyces halstedii]